MTRALSACLVCLVAAGCGSDSTAAPADSGPPDARSDSLEAGLVDAGTDAAAVDQAAGCAVVCDADAGPPPGGTCFGAALTDGFGRVDGTLLAVQRPTDTQCALPNDDHLIVQVLVAGVATRMVVNVLSDGRNGTDTRLRFAEVEAPLPAPDWQEGWHVGAALDYVGTLGVHTGDFTPFAMDELVEQVASRLQVGDPVSVYATSNGLPDSAHLVHRNAANRDGAIVVGPDTGTPHFLVFHFDGQAF